MATFASLSENDKHSLLTSRGAALGLSFTDVIKLIEQFGPLVVDLLLKLLEAKRTAKVSPTLPGGIGGDLLKTLLLNLLLDNKDMVEQWINSGESALIDALAAVLAGTRGAAVGQILEQYKAAIVGLDDTVTDEILTKAIDILKNLPVPANQ